MAGSSRVVAEGRRDRREDARRCGLWKRLFYHPRGDVLEGQIYAIDIDESLLAQLGEDGDERTIENITTVCCDARSLSDHISPVNVAIMANTFHGVEQQTKFAAEICRTLNSDGRFIVVNWHDLPRRETVVAGKSRGPPEKRRMTPEETTEIVVPAGSDLVAEFELPPYHYALVFERENDR